MAHPGTVKGPSFSTPANDWGVEVFAHHDANRTNANMTFHGVSIGAGRDDAGGLTGSAIKPIGRITSWQPQLYTRSAQHTYELGSTTFGRPVDLTPAGNTGYTVSMTRVEVWQQEAEVAFGLTTTDSVYEDLMDQDRPFRADEVLLRGTAVYRHWRYRGCWFTNLNPNGFEAEGGDVRVVRTGEFMFVRRSKEV
jgi:hypothetical protein